MYVIDTEKHPIKSWCMTPEESSLVQARNLANLPFLFRWLALMPDTHMGYGMPIGGVAALLDVICPNMVGLDIGCGMHVVKTSLTQWEATREQLKLIMKFMRENIPVGHNHHNTSQMSARELFGEIIVNNVMTIVDQEAESATRQVGTLGGGNHFMEIQIDQNGYLWIMLHSGSRNLGKKVAEHHIKIANELNEKWFTAVPKEWQLAFLPRDTQEAENYLVEMEACLTFAKKNRELMADRIKTAFLNVFPNCTFEQELDVHHNYAALEHHYGKNVFVHRKGATSARAGQLGIIPGSQGTASYIVVGKGNPESFTSCSHGAGRKMGRKQAQRELDFEEEKAKLDGQGILHAMRHKDDLEEASSAYKDIDVVMAEQADLVDIVVKLRPLGVVKG